MSTIRRPIRSVTQDLLGDPEAHLKFINALIKRINTLEKELDTLKSQPNKVIYTSGDPL